VLLIRPVIEVRPTYGEPTPWPVATLPDWSWLPLDGHRTDDEVAFVVAAVTGGETLDELFASEDRILAGGLQVHDTGTGATVSPGCCGGLEDWRTWLGLLAGDTGLWLGHDPAPNFEHLDDRLRLWQDEQRHGPFVDLTLAELPGLLQRVHHDLNAFLTLTGRWAGEHGPALMTVLDDSFAITAPLEPSRDTGTPGRSSGP
jgi:hypothetical protein